MRIGLPKKIDKQGRVSIPVKYREVYHLNNNDEVFLVETPNGLLITNPKYKTVKIEEDK